MEERRKWTEVLQEQQSHYEPSRRTLRAVGGDLTGARRWGRRWRVEYGQERKQERQNSGKCHSKNSCCHGDSFKLSNWRSRKHKRRQAAASHSESVFPLHQAARRGGVASPGGRTRANRRKTSRLCLASLSAFLPQQHFRKEEQRFLSPTGLFFLFHFATWLN